MQANTPFFLRLRRAFAIWLNLAAFRHFSRRRSRVMLKTGLEMERRHNLSAETTFDMLFAIGETTVYALRWGVPTLPRFFHTARVGMGGTN